MVAVIRRLVQRKGVRIRRRCTWRLAIRGMQEASHKSLGQATRRHTRSAQGWGARWAPERERTRSLAGRGTGAQARLQVGGQLGVDGQDEQLGHALAKVLDALLRSLGSARTQRRARAAAAQPLAHIFCRPVWLCAELMSQDSLPIRDQQEPTLP